MITTFHEPAAPCFYLPGTLDIIHHREHTFMAHLCCSSWHMTGRNNTWVALNKQGLTLEGCGENQGGLTGTVARLYDSAPLGPNTAQPQRGPVQSRFRPEAPVCLSARMLGAQIYKTGRRAYHTNTLHNKHGTQIQTGTVNWCSNHIPVWRRTCVAMIMDTLNLTGHFYDKLDQNNVEQRACSRVCVLQHQHAKMPLNTVMLSVYNQRWCSRPETRQQTTHLHWSRSQGLARASVRKRPRCAT